MLLKSHLKKRSSKSIHKHTSTRMLSQMLAKVNIFHGQTFIATDQPNLILPPPQTFNLSPIYRSILNSILLNYCDHRTNKHAHHFCPPTGKNFAPETTEWPFKGGWGWGGSWKMIYGTFGNWLRLAASPQPTGHSFKDVLGRFLAKYMSLAHFPGTNNQPRNAVYKIKVSLWLMLNDSGGTELILNRPEAQRGSDEHLTFRQ